MEHIYEVIDATSDEMYFSMGFFESLESAKEKIIELDKPDCNITESADYECFESIEIRKHKANAFNYNYVPVFKLDRSKEYIEETDQYSWKSTIVKDISHD